MRLYYDDAIIGAYMAREFDISILILNDRFEPDNGEDPYVWSNLWRLIIERWHNGSVHPDSYSIFEPMAGDMVTVIGMNGWWVRRVDGDKLFHADDKYTLKAEAKIIQRDSKPFFSPKEER